MKKATQEDMRAMLDEFVANGGSIDNIKEEDEKKYKKIKDWVVRDESGRKLSLEEKFSLLGHERKSKKVLNAVEEMKKRVEAFVDAGGKLENLKRDDELYKYIHGVHLKDKDGKFLTMQEKFLLVGHDRAPVYSQDVRQDLIDEIEAYLASGGSFHIRRKDLPFYERLHTYAQILKRERGLTEELTYEQVMRELGYRNYSDTYYLYHDLDGLQEFRNANGFVDDYRKDEKLKAKINELSQKLQIPIAVLVGVFAGENLERYSLSSDYFGYIQNQLQEYVKIHGNLKGLTKDKLRYAKVLFLKNRVATDLGEKLSVEDIVDLLGFGGVEGDFKAKRKENKNAVKELAKFCQEIKRNNGGVLKKADIPQSLYRVVLQKSLKHGITTKAYLKSFDVDYVDGRDVPRLSRFLVKEYPHMQEMRTRRDELLSAFDGQGLCEEELFEKRLEVCIAVYDEFKDKIVDSYDFKGFMDFDPEEEMGDSTENNQNYEYATAKPVMGGIDLACGK